METRGLLVRGEIRPQGVQPEWCDAEVVRRLRRRTLARLRRQVAPVPDTTLARFLPGWQGLETPCRHALPPEGVLGAAEQILDALAPLEGLALPWSAWTQAVLPLRLPRLRLEDLDGLAASGRLVWLGAGALGPRDGRVQLCRRERAPLLLDPPDPADARGPVHRCVLEHLARRGACFVTELEQALGPAGINIPPGDLDAVLWDLVWVGQLTNDTFALLRTLSRSSGRRRATAGLGGGRWSRVADLLAPPAAPEARALARARMLLDRYGVVSREAVQAEGLSGGFAPLYQVLKGMEEAGQVRRGHFVEGFSGAQFARPAAVERLRGVREEDPPADGFGAEDTLLLATIDPANPYGALLPWPAPGDPRAQPRRTAGAWVVLVAGRPVLYLGTGGRRLTSFACADSAPGPLPAALRALRGLGRTLRRRSLVIETVDGVPVHESRLLARLLAAGSEAEYKGVRIDLS